MRDDARGSADRDRKADSNEPAHSDGGGLRTSDDGDGRDGMGRETNRVSPLKSLNTAQLPNVSDGYWRQALQAASEAARERLRNGDDFLDLPDRLEANAYKSLEVNFEHLHLNPSDYDDDSSLVLSRVARVKQNAVNTALNTLAKVHELKLKKVAQEDTLKRVLETMLEEKARLQLEAFPQQAT
jgi:hypothetical protein